MRRLATARKGLPLAIATLCVLAGVLGSLLGARAIARRDATHDQQAFQQTSTSIASTLNVAIRHEEQLVVSASTFFADHPQATPGEFASWTNWARMVHRYPELAQLALITLVRAPQLPAFVAQISGHTPSANGGTTGSANGGTTGSEGKAGVASVGTAGVASVRTATYAGTAAGAADGGANGGTTTTVATTTTTAAQGTTQGAARSKAAPPASALPRITPSSTHGYYCLTTAELATHASLIRPAGFDYCARSMSLLLARDTGRSVYTPIRVGHAQALEIVTPVYRGENTPRTLMGRQAASVGWLHEVLVPAAVLRQALVGQSGYALHVRYRGPSTNVAFAEGAPQAGAQSVTIALHGGWSMRSYGPAPGGSVLADPSALALLFGGILASVLLGALVLVLGAGLPPASAAAAVPAARPTPHEDLYDALTGLPNRALMLDRAERILARAGRHSEIVGGALCVDIDWVRDVNDKLGRAAGDQLLQAVAQRLERTIRTGDTVGRIGGDEFVILVESTARGVRLDSLARRVLETLHEPVELDGFGPSVFLSASVGVAFGRYTSPADLLRDAHQAAKAAGKDRYTLFNANMRSIVESRGVLEVELSSALHEGEMFLLYQPIWDLSARRVVDFEALVRWQHPTRGALAPAEFVPLAEDTGLIVPLGRWMLETACIRAAAWTVAGRQAGVTVRVSTAQLDRDGLITDVRRALQQSGLEPSLLTLAIPETAVIGGGGGDLAAAAERLREIKQLGVRIALDDFGSAYASHADLRRLSLDFLKVDRGSLAASDTEDYRSWLLETILLAGRDLALTVIAKGIDTREQLTTLQAKGCTMAQGALLGEPVPPDGLDGLFDATAPDATAPDATAPDATAPEPATVASGNAGSATATASAEPAS